MTELHTRHDPAVHDRLEHDTATLVTIGGGLGSFALIDRLRITGVPADELRVVGRSADPSDRFTALCRSSGMHLGDRLRSDSSARMDNIWGFPGYAVSEAVRRRTPGPLLRTLVEPLAAQPYTPTVGLMVDSLAREAARIGWHGMVTIGEAYHIAELPTGGYVVLVSRTGQPDLAIRTRWVHLALGPAGPQLCDVSESFRSHFGAERVVHAYEDHEEAYQLLRRGGGRVLVRGSGIASSRVLERLIEDRDRTRQEVHIWQLFRTYHAAPTGPRTQRYDAGHGFHYQSYSFPKAAFGGQIRDQIRSLDEAERIELIRRLGSTSTPYRSDWARQLRRGRTEGWYEAVVGELAGLAPRPDGVRAAIVLATKERLDLDLDVLIDATGLDTTAAHHPLVAGLVEDGLAEVNDLDCLRVDDDFVVSCSTDTADGTSGIVASGMTAKGAPYAPVDSFHGLQNAALTIARRLCDEGIGRPLTPLRSLRSWWSWMGGRSL